MAQTKINIFGRAARLDKNEFPSTLIVEAIVGKLRIGIYFCTERDTFAENTQGLAPNCDPKRDFKYWISNAGEKSKL